MADDVFGVLRPAHPNSPKTIIVLGAPRGGTSMVAATLRALGVMMGERLGHQHEDPAFRREVPISDMVDTIQQRNAAHDVWGWKLPNSVYYVEKLLPHVRNPHFVAIFRNPYSVSQSSASRDKREYSARLLQVAANHTKLVVDLIARLDAPTAVSSFEAVLQKPDEFVRGLAEFLGTPATDDMIRNIVAETIRRDLGYIRFEPKAAKVEKPAPPVEAVPAATAHATPAASLPSSLNHIRLEPKAGRVESPAPGYALAAVTADLRPGTGGSPGMTHTATPSTLRGGAAILKTLSTAMSKRSVSSVSDDLSDDEEESYLRGRKKRAARIAGKFTHLPNTIDYPFFTQLQERWPAPPSLANPISQMCTAAQFREPDYLRICALLKVKPWLHRKQWEFAYIIRSLEAAGALQPGARGLVFGVGHEKLPALFVSNGCRVTATDLPLAEGNGQWVGGPQHATAVDNIFHPKLVDRDLFYANTEFRPVNMNAIPSDLVGYDFCWSSCALEHLGNLKNGLDFIKNSIKCLRPGGVAVHTTEFNLGSATNTLEEGPSVAYRESDLVAFSGEMATQGNAMELTLNPGTEPTDRMIDRDRDSDIHLRLYIRHKIVGTSVGLCIRRKS